MSSPAVKKAVFNYRCFKQKELYKPTQSETVTKQFHLELGEKNQTIIVEDRPVDWVELANKDVDQVGLANVLRLMQKGLVDARDLAFKESEALDLGSLDPSDPESIKETLASQQANVQKLEALASRLGCSVDELIDATINGTIAEFVQSKVETPEVKEGE